MPIKRMSKCNKNKGSLNFPTIDQFNKNIEPIINTQKPVIQVGPVKPILPEYLIEKPITRNPFQDIKESKIRDLENAEKSRKLFDAEKRKQFPVNELVTRDICLKFNANHKTKIFKYEMDLEEAMNDSTDKSIIKPHKSKFMSNYDFIVGKRKVCLLDLAINMKQEQFNKLDNIIKEEEKRIKLENEQLRKERDAHEKYLKQICHKTSDAIKLSEKEAAKKNNISKMVKGARYNVAHLNAECVKLEEEYLQLKTYQEFLKKCFENHKQKQKLERKSLFEEKKITTIKKGVDLDNQLIPRKSYELESNDINYITGLINFDKEFNLSNVTRKLTIDDLQKIKEYILTGVGDSNDNNQNNIIETIRKNYQEDENNTTDVDDSIEDSSSREKDIYFKDPQELVDILTELESTNLSLIENVQEQEELCEHMRNRVNLLKHEMNKQINAIDKHIEREQNKIEKLKESIDSIKETETFLTSFNNLERYKNLFYFGNLKVKTPDEMMDYLQNKITELYNSVFNKADSTKWSTIEMLKQIEILIDSLYIDLQKYDKAVILRSKKIVDDRKRKAARIRQKEMCKEAELLKIQRAMEKALEPPRYHVGRKVVYRSEPPKLEIKEFGVDGNGLKEKEENDFFFQ